MHHFSTFLDYVLNTYVQRIPLIKYFMKYCNIKLLKVVYQDLLRNNCGASLFVHWTALSIQLYLMVKIFMRFGIKILCVYLTA